MANFQYKTSSGAAYADVPTAAFQGTYDGTLEVRYPDAGEMDGLGRACGAIGQPQISLHSGLMTATGMDFWQNLFATTTATYVELWLKVLDVRTNSWDEFHGYLQRPKFSRMIPGSSSTTIWYYDVEITMQAI